MKKIAVAMSGGVDSTVAVALLQKDGYEVVGITLDMLGDGEVIQKAKELATKMDIEFHSFDVSSVFKEKVIDYFADSYKKGETPSPCIMCNKFLKFGLLIDKAIELGCEKMATGHYVVKKDGDLYMGEDQNKDQTYFLFNLTQKQIDFCEFPLGTYAKEEIVSLAKEYGIMPSGGESQDLCFVDNGKYAEFIEKADELPLATLVDAQGNVLKQHKSVIHYTIGQRKGLDIGGLSEPKYVIKIDANKNEVVVGSREELATTKVYLRDINWLAKNDKLDEVFVKLRYKQKLTLVELHLEKGYIELSTPDFAVAPGQAAVFYDKSGRLLGGAFIKI